MRGRKPHSDPPVKLQLYLPSSLVKKLELLVYDPLLQKPKYGARSELIASLIRERLDQLAKENKQ